MFSHRLSATTEKKISGKHAIVISDAGVCDIMIVVYLYQGNPQRYTGTRVYVSCILVLRFPRLCSRFSISVEIFFHVPGYVNNVRKNMSKRSALFEELARVLFAH